MTSIHVSATLKAIRLKSGTASDPEPVAEIVFITDSLRAATELAWQISKELEIDCKPWQQRLPVTDADWPKLPEANGTEKTYAPAAGRRRGTMATVMAGSEGDEDE